MIYSISGLLRQVAPTYCVVEACGVGYQCSASTHTLSSLPGRGQEVTLLTHLWVKEDGMELFGFSTEQERRCFRMLIGVSGVGPRVALAIAICHGHNGGSRLPTAALAEIRGGNRRGKPITYKEKKT